MPTEEKRYAIHCAEAKNGRGLPECWLPWHAVKALLETKQAEWGNPNKMTWVRMKKTKNELPKMARSLKPGLRVIEGFIAGNVQDIAIIEAYRPTWAWAA